MSFLYPRTISISRPTSTQSVGLLPFQGLLPQNEPVIAENVPASIQAASTGRNNTGSVTPSAAPGPIHWQIFIPLNALPKGTVKTADVVTDDEGARYIVEAPYWNSLGWRLSAIRLEVA